MNSLVAINKVCQKKIVFISDLHFDFVKEKESGHRYAPEYSEEMQSAFIKYVKENFSNDILLLGGDFYNDTHKTLNFIKEMETNQILGFFVLGNHDYWNKEKLSHEEIITYFSIETAEHNWFRFLKKGTKYYIDDLCFIGDTGWTSFERKVEEHVRKVSLEQFMELPDAKGVRDFSPKKIRTFHKEWIKFANQVLMQEQKVIVLTHFPMIDLTEEDKDCWWSSQTRLIDTDNQWQIYGHTHKKQCLKCNITEQRGYDNKIIKKDTTGLYEEIKSENLQWRMKRAEEIIEIRRAEKRPVKIEKLMKIAQKVNEEEVNKRFIDETNQYTSTDFGILINVSDECKLPVSFKNISNKFYSTELVASPNEKSQFSKLGYKRCAANKKNFAELAFNKEKYLKKVREEIEATLKSNEERIGYYNYTCELEMQTIESLVSAADYLDQNDMTNDVRAFITAAIITGFAWNRELLRLKNMRPVNDYDIIRFFMQFLTMKKYKITFRKIDSIKRSKKDKITFGNMEIWLPMVNDKQLTIKQVMQEISQTTLIEHISKE